MDLNSTHGVELGGRVGEGSADIMKPIEDCCVPNGETSLDRAGHCDMGGLGDLNPTGTC